MLPHEHSDRIQIAFDDHRLVANAGLLLPVTLAQHLGLRALVDRPPRPRRRAGAGAAFKDTWTLSDLDVAWMGLVADQQPAVYSVLQAAREDHG